MILQAHEKKGQTFGGGLVHFGKNSATPPPPVWTAGAGARASGCGAGCEGAPASLAAYDVNCMAKLTGEDQKKFLREKLEEQRHLLRKSIKEFATGDLTEGLL